MGLLISICVGISLSASAGLRAFLPLFVTGLLAKYDMVPLGESFGWLSETPALVALGVATGLEMAGDKVPALDHFLDLIQGPVRTGAGMVVFAAVAADLPTWATALSAVVAGGGVAATVHTAKSAVRVGSTATTGGLGNPVLSIGEDLLAVAASVLSILFAALAVVFAFMTLIVGFFVFRKLLRWWRGRGDADADEPEPPAVATA